MDLGPVGSQDVVDQSVGLEPTAALPSAQAEPVQRLALGEGVGGAESVCGCSLVHTLEGTAHAQGAPDPKNRPQYTGESAAGGSNQPYGFT